MLRLLMISPLLICLLVRCREFALVFICLLVRMRRFFLMRLLVVLRTLRLLRRRFRFSLLRILLFIIRLWVSDFVLANSFPCCFVLAAHIGVGWFEPYFFFR